MSNPIIVNLSLTPTKRQKKRFEFPRLFDERTLAPTGTFLDDDQFYPEIPWSEIDELIYKGPCPKCGARVGDIHALGCPKRLCPRCGEVASDCECYGGLAALEAQDNTEDNFDLADVLTSRRSHDHRASVSLPQDVR